MTWNLTPGSQIRRTLLHDEYGGGRQGGIGPCRKSPNVLIFSDAAAGEQHGYFDGWFEDGCFHYTGEGKRGNQVMNKGNAAILNHLGDNRTLRVFKGVRGIVTYLGIFEVDEDVPWYWSKAPETNGGPIRDVIVFRLRPVEVAKELAEEKSATWSDMVRLVPIEANNTQTVRIERPATSWTASREESALVQRFSAYMEAQGHAVAQRHVIRIPNKPSSIMTDVFIQDINMLIEAKASSSRNDIRMAIGQLLDYRRYCDYPDSALLLPDRPDDDLLELIQQQGFGCYFETEDTFERV